MVFLGVQYWTTTYPVVGVLEKLFPDEFGKCLLVTDDINEAAEFIEEFSP